MTNERFNNLEKKIESNVLNNENALALTETLHEKIENVSRYANSSDRELALIEFERTAKRMETLFFMLQGTLEETTQNNNKLLEEVSQLKNEMVTA